VFVDATLTSSVTGTELAKASGMNPFLLQQLRFIEVVPQHRITGSGRGCLCWVKGWPG